MMMTGDVDVVDVVLVMMMFHEAISMTLYGATRYVQGAKRGAAQEHRSEIGHQGAMRDIQVKQCRV